MSPLPSRPPLDHDVVISEARRALDAALAGEAPGWSGPELTWCRLLATQFQPSEDLSPEGLARHADQGRDAVAVVLSVVFRLGIEQGAVLAAEDVRDLARMSASIVGTLAEQIGIGEVVS